MLLRLLRTHARPYLPWVVGVLVFQLISTIATLSLPSLNARIIDNLSLIHISEPTRQCCTSRMPSSA